MIHLHIIKNEAVRHYMTEIRWDGWKWELGVIYDNREGPKVRRGWRLFTVMLFGWTYERCSWIE